MTSARFLDILKKESEAIKAANNRIDEACKEISLTLASKLSKALGETYKVIYKGKLNFDIRPQSEESYNDSEIFVYHNSRIGEVVVRFFCPSAKEVKVEVILDNFFDKELEL